MLCYFSHFPAVSSLFEDTAANSSVQPTPPTSPTPSDKPANDPLFRSLNQGDLKDMFSKRSAVLGLPEPGRLQRSGECCIVTVHLAATEWSRSPGRARMPVH